MIDVFINDSGSPAYDETREYFSSIDTWARENCKSYSGYHVQEVSDVSDLWDYIAVYHFKKQSDANWFVLRWKHDHN